MKNKFYSLAILGVMMACGEICPQSTPSVKAQYVQHCTVNDPTSTELNIRSVPNGKKIVGKLKNGTRVAFDTESGDGRDNSWAHVWIDKKPRKALGWVLRAYLDCD